MHGTEVLIVDERQPTAPPEEQVLCLLQEHGISALTVTFDEAIARIQDGQRPDAIFFERNLAEDSGDNFLSAAAPTPVIFLSTCPSIRRAVDAMRHGASDYLHRPVTWHEDLLPALLRIQTSAPKEPGDELAQLLQNLEVSYDVTLQALGDALDLRDCETEGHSKRVTGYTIALARMLGLEAEDLRVIARGAFLHDIGKLATPDAILLKPGRLDDNEMAIMREHCTHGYHIVRKIPFLAEAAEIVYTHQEKYDGSGYPQRLCADDIPLGSRIFAIADTLDAITSERPYRPASTFEQAREEIARCSGGQFDPSLVGSFLDSPLAMWQDLRAEIMIHSPGMIHTATAA